MSGDEDREQGGGSSDPEMSKMQLELRLVSQRCKALELELEVTRAKGNSGTGAGENSGTPPSRDAHAELRHFSKLLAGALPKFPTEAEVPVWFESVENTLEAYAVPRELWGQIVFPLIAEKVQFLSTRLTPSEHKAYETLKKTVLEELKLSAGEYLRRFLTTRKRANEGWRPFATRIQSYLNFYLDARGVKTFDELVELLVADQLKNNLSEGALRYVTLQEGNKWEKASALSARLQTFEETEGKGSASKKAEAKDAQFPYVRQEKGAKEPPKQGAAKQFGDKRAPRGCFACGALGHQKAKCPHGTKKQPSQAPSNTNNSLSARVATEGVKGAHSELQPVTLKCLNSQIGAILDTGAEITVLRESAVPAELVKPHGTIGLVSAFGEKVNAKLAVVPLNIARETGVFAEIRETVPVLCALTDKLVSRTDCLLSREAWESLTNECDMKGLVTVGEEEATARAEIELAGREAGEAREGTEGLRVAVSQIGAKGGCSQSREDNAGGEQSGLEEAGESSASAEFRRAQQSDETLQSAWKNGRTGKGGMIIREGLLYHKDKLLGQPVRQLVLPEGRRKEVLQVAHESNWGGHLGFRKTKARIKYNFFWPGMEDEIRRYCSSCHGCQTRADLRHSDSVPIEPLVRPKYPFEQVNVDVIGPLEPPSARGHRYALCIVDLCTRWPEVVCMRSLSARATCDALLSVFTRTGIPEVIASDCGTNFTAELTKEFLGKLGCSPRFSTPGHPESNGAVERWNRTFKNMLAHTIQKEGRDWDKFVPFLLWAYREVPHDTTGVAPFQMLYGRTPSGPLSVARRMWEGEGTVPAALGPSPSAYMRDMMARLDRAAEAAELMSRKQQNAYASQFNKRAAYKSFQAGEAVLVFDDQRPGKMFPKWKGPGTVVGGHREHSYFVEMPEGGRKLVHASKLRPYQSRVSTVGVMFDEDGAFGEVDYAPRLTDERSSGMVLPESMTAHLEERARADIRAVFAEHEGLFEDKPGMAKWALACRSVLQMALSAQ
ncbi:uncharacterized protein LOC144143402 [Haemaphysalis longicornis]